MAKQTRKSWIASNRFASDWGGLGQIHPRKVPRVYLFGALLFALVICLSSGFGKRLFLYPLGSIANQSIRSRVRFPWHDSEEEAREIKRLEESYARRYVEESKQDFLDHFYEPLWRLLEKGAESAEKLAVNAKEKKINLSPAQAKIIFQTIKGEQGIFWDIISPFRRVLEGEIYDRGLMTEERYLIERGRFIQVIRGGKTRRAYVTYDAESGPIPPNRLASIFDQQFSAEMPRRINLEFRNTLRDILIARARPTITFDAERSELELAREKAEIFNRTSEIAPGDILVVRGEYISLNLLGKFRAEEDAFALQQGWMYLWSRFMGKFILLTMVAVAFVSGFCAIKPEGAERDTQVVVIGTLALLLTIGGCGIVWLGLPATLYPIGILAGVSLLGTGRRLALLSIMTVCFAFMILLEGHSESVLGLLSSGLVFVFLASPIRHRFSLIGIGALSSLIGALVVLSWDLAAGQGMEFGNWLKLAGGGGPLLRGAGLLPAWILSVAIVILLIPAIESVFHATTNIRLQDLQDQDQPCLRQMVIEAPGSYHHSVIVGTLAESAAESIGANPLLAKVGSYYHDIGKLMKPEYFTENETGVSRHDHLSPSMSTLIITAHVKDGAEMGREYGLPKGIVDIIEQHHGCGKVSFFLHRAKQQAEEGEKIIEESFRYPGPRPQTPEAALVMLADAVEAATRSLDEPSPAHIRKLVHELVSGRLMDGQLEESGLTLTQLGIIEQSFCQILTSMFHSRVRYPGNDKKDSRRQRRRRYATGSKNNQ